MNDLQHKPNGSPVTAEDLAWAQRVTKLLERQKRSHPNRSTTHEERFYHVEQDGTVFFRKEDDGYWYASVVIRDDRDPFIRSKGRSEARRKYFNHKRKRIKLVSLTLPDYQPSYEVAEQIVTDAWKNRFNHLTRNH